MFAWSLERGGRGIGRNTLHFEVGPETRTLIERLAGKVIVEVELGPETRKVIKEFLH